MGADGAVRDFGWLLGVTQGESRRRALTEEQQRGQAKDRPLLLTLKSPTQRFLILPRTPLRAFMRWLLEPR